MACQILLEQVDLINGQRDDLAVHVGADQNHRAGQVVLAAHLQHLRRVVAEQQRGVGKVQAGIVLLKAGQDVGSLVQRDDGQFHIRGNGCEVDLAAPVCRQCSADTHINGDFLGANGTGSVVFHRRFLLLITKEKDPIGSFHYGIISVHSGAAACAATVPAT